MGVTFKAVDAGEALANYAPDLAAALKAKGITFKVGLAHTSMIGPDGVEIEGSQIKVKPNDLKMMAKAKPGFSPAGNNFIMSVADTLHKLEMKGWKPVESPTLNLLMNQKMKENEGKSPFVPASTTYAQPSAANVETNLLGPQVKLREATKLYQPVFATSAGSRYFTVAVSAGVKVAARYKGGKLSIRVEGSKLDEVKDVLAEQGFDIGKAENAMTCYMSIHLDPGHPILAARTLGSVLCGMGISFDTPLPNLNVFIDKGQ